MKIYYVYIMASHKRVLYIDVTSKLEHRVWQHKHDVFPEGFSVRYRTHKLVYFETYSDVVTAITREKELKGWIRSRKVALIDAENPKWRDLSKDWGKKIAPLPVYIPAAGNDRDRVSPDPSLGKERRAQDDTSDEHFLLEEHKHFFLLRLKSEDSTNRLTKSKVLALTKVICNLDENPKPLILTGNKNFFSAGADLHEVAALSGAQAYEFAKMGQALMNTVDQFPAPIYAAVEGYCLGGGLDLALACDCRIAAPNAVFGHRGAALGLITGWGGTQRLPRLIGKGRALQMFCAAEKVDVDEARRIGLIHAIAEDPVAHSITMATESMCR
ncbi:MAG TPA: enoyl-CoA hydratase-related protein [Terriglobales bacterium]|nr:enoyl-CoA hydratase-related protein [Terriglobales bacterium]